MPEGKGSDPEEEPMETRPRSVHAVPLGDGRRLFDHLGSDHIELDLLRRLDPRAMTHLRYRVRRPNEAA